jgi:hypothetical protein
VAFYRLQGSYLYRKELSFGFQALGDFGTWNNWESSQAQGHRMGTVQRSEKSASVTNKLLSTTWLTS